MEKDQPTLLLDEVDSIYSGKGEVNDALRGVINAGNRRGATYDRCVGDSQTLTGFRVFGPKLLAGIDNNKLPDTITDRAMRIRLRKRLPDEPMERWRRRREHEADPFRERAAMWAKQNVSRLQDMEPDMPDPLSDRAQDAWEPLVAIAELAGSDWATKARAAAEHLFGEEQDNETLGTMLLRDIHRASFLGNAEAVFTKDLLPLLNGLEEAPWGAWRGGQGLTDRNVAGILRPYGVKPRSVRIGDRTLKGYHREQFEDAWRRHLPELRNGPPAGSQPSQRHNPHSNRENSAFLSVTEPSGVTDENGRNPAPQAGCDVVTAKTGQGAQDAVSEGSEATAVAPSQASTNASSARERETPAAQRALGYEGPLAAYATVKATPEQEEQFERAQRLLRGEEEAA